MEKGLPIVHAVHPDAYQHMSTEQLRNYFLLSSLYQPGAISLTYTHYDRMIAGLAVPLDSPLPLHSFANLKSLFFLERREVGIINIGGEGRISVEDASFTLNKYDCLYIGRGAERVAFESANPDHPAIFYLLSTPAHATYPTTFLRSADAVPLNLGNKENCNERELIKYIHADGIQSCQLVMGITKLQPGSVWNSVPPHTHDRRCEIYLYFDMAEDQRVFHFMGLPQQTKHLVVQNYEAVASPSWSVHFGCGTSNYSFIWGMAGENKEFTDMDPAPVHSLL